MKDYLHFLVALLPLELRRRLALSPVDGGPDRRRVARAQRLLPASSSTAWSPPA